MSADLALQARLMNPGASYVLPLRDAPGKAWPDEQHPLARFLDLDLTPTPPRMVIPGFVQAGIVVIAGTQGAGKTTVLAPLAMVAAGLHAAGDELAPRHWRHVVYISEDAAQVLRIISGVVRHAGMGIDPATVAARLHVVPAMRMPASDVAAVGPMYRERFSRNVDGVELPPLIVIDTRSATVEVTDENDNAEAGRTVALFKQQFCDMPVWLVGHLSKALASRKDVQALSTRGAGAIEADAHQTMYLVAEDDGRRFLVLGKRRFEPKWTELEVHSATAEVETADEYGEPVAVTLRWGWPVPPTQTRGEAREELEERERIQRKSEMRAAVLDAVQAAELTGMPLSRSLAAARAGGRAAEARACVAMLEHEQWLLAVHVPRALRTNPRRDEFLIRLSDAERRLLLEGKTLPPGRLSVPRSWRKSDVSQPDATGPGEGAE